ncbi:hypothetical protein LZ554_004601 [Drepanopeziza brunnea f. sp. 'monogermtubi']|nr:hypothetical protein LZ554_004601 [Drepanopeziza brunnea f. sp. 'monogermtubi']
MENQPLHDGHSLAKDMTSHISSILFDDTSSEDSDARSVIYSVVDEAALEEPGSTEQSTKDLLPRDTHAAAGDDLPDDQNPKEGHSELQAEIAPAISEDPYEDTVSSEDLSSVDLAEEMTDESLSDTNEFDGQVEDSLREIERVTKLSNDIAQLIRLAGPFMVELSLTPAPQVNPEACLDGAPPDVRMLIYKYLLVNPDLGEVTSISKHEHYGATASYGLSPAILVVNKKIHGEAMSILYGLNTFVMACSPCSEPFGSPAILSPLTRFLPGPNGSSSSIYGEASISHVKKWKVIISVDVRSFPLREMVRPSWSVWEACRALSRGSPRSVEIALIPKGVELNVFESDYQSLGIALQPLKILRGIENFVLRDTTPFEIPDFVDEDENALEFTSQLQDETVLEVDLYNSATSNSPVERGFEMFNELLIYAQAFERSPTFRQEMSPIGDERYGDVPEPALSGDDLHLYHQLGNPFQIEDLVHPIEAALRRAEALVRNEEDIPAFKNERDFILQYLEREFRSISAAHDGILEFVRDEKVDDGFFDSAGDPDQGNTWPQYYTAMVLLEDYEASFQRESPLDIRASMREHQKYYERLYEDFGVGKTQMADLNTAIEKQNYAGFHAKYKSAVDKLDGQFLAICRARKSLFKWDPEALDDRRCDIEPQLYRSEELIVWDVNEPNLTPLTYEQHRWISSDQGDDSTGSESGDGWDRIRGPAGFNDDADYDDEYRVVGGEFVNDQYGATDEYDAESEEEGSDLSSD